MLKLPKGKFGAIMADPAIKFDTWSRAGEGRTPQHHYRCPAFDKLAAIPVASVAAADCFLFLWVPSRSVFLVEPLMNAWGFVFSGKAFAWAKQNPSGVGWAHGDRLHHSKEHGGLLAWPARQATTEIGRRA